MRRENNELAMITVHKKDLAHLNQNNYSVDKEEKMDSGDMYMAEFIKIPLLSYLNIQRGLRTMDDEKDSGLNMMLAGAFKMQFIHSMP